MMEKVDTSRSAGSLKACCLISQMLEEMGLDSRKARQIRRQTLLGLMTFCQWQLSRIDDAEAEVSAAEASAPDAPKGARRPRGRRVKVV
jgi:hypothetical protein